MKKAADKSPGRVAKAEAVKVESLRGRSRRRATRATEPLIAFALRRALAGPKNRELRAAYEDDPELRRVVTARVIERIEEGDEPDDIFEDRPFLNWLFKNLPWIIALIRDLMAGVPPTIPTPA